LTETEAQFFGFKAAEAALKEPIPIFASQKEGIGREGIGN